MAKNDRDKTNVAQPGDTVECWVHGDGQELILIPGTTPPGPDRTATALALECRACFEEMAEACGFPAVTERTLDQTTGQTRADADGAGESPRRRTGRFRSGRKSVAWIDTLYYG